MNLTFELKAKNQVNRLCKLIEELKILDKNADNNSNGKRKDVMCEFSPPFKKMKLNLLDNKENSEVSDLNSNYKLIPFASKSSPIILSNQNQLFELKLPCGHLKVIIDRSQLQNYQIKCLNKACYNTYSFCLDRLVNNLVYYHCNHKSECYLFNEKCPECTD